MHLERHFFILKSQLLILFYRSLLPSIIEKRPKRLRLKGIEIEWDWRLRLNGILFSRSLWPSFIEKRPKRLRLNDIEMISLAKFHWKETQEIEVEWHWDWMMMEIEIEWDWDWMTLRLNDIEIEWHWDWDWMTLSRSLWPKRPWSLFVEKRPRRLKLEIEIERDWGWMTLRLNEIGDWDWMTSYSLGLFGQVSLKRDPRDGDWRLRLNDTRNAVGFTAYCIWRVV